MELFQINQTSEMIIPESQVITLPENKQQSTEFLGSNTEEVTLEHLINDTITPVFAKDGEVAVSHSQFIECMQKAILNVFPDYRATQPVVRVSHIIKGRIASAINKPAKELLETDKTIWYERCAFILKIPGVTQIVNGNELTLTVGGVRAFNKENLYSKKSIEQFSIFIGFINKICTNLCISSDGIKEELRVSNILELQNRMELLFHNYDQEKHLGNMERMSKFELSQEQVAHLIGKMKLYHYLEKSKRIGLFPIEFNDTQINSISKNYYRDEHFKSENNGSINLWKLYNIMTDSVKSSYIDSFLNRDCQAYEFIQMLANSLQNDSSNFYLTT